MIGPFFPRGPGPLVSVLLPTRGRAAGLVQAVRSLYERADDEGCLEFLLKVDDDDVETVRVARGLAEQFPGSRFVVVVSPRGRGYADLHLWLSNLAQRAAGDWLLVFNDDARMVSPGWDTHVKNMVVRTPWVGIDEVCYLWTVHDESGLPTSQLYLLRRSTYALLGRVGVHCMDSYMRLVMDTVLPRVVADVRIAHDSPGGQDEVLRNEYILYDDLRHGSDVRRAKVRDISKLSHHLDVLEEQKLRAGPPEAATWSVHVGPEGAILYAVDEAGKVSYFDGAGLRPAEVPANGRWAVISSW
jgi:hypothetical protein